SSARRAAARPRPWPRRSPHDRNSVSMPTGGAPVDGSAKRACSSSNPPAAFHRRGTPGAVVVGDPTSGGGSRTAGLGCHSSTRGPAGSIVAATSAANVLPASNPCPVQGPDPGASTPPVPPTPPPPPPAAGAPPSYRSRGRPVPPAVVGRPRRLRGLRRPGGGRGEGRQGPTAA